MKRRFGRFWVTIGTLAVLGVVAMVVWTEKTALSHDGRTVRGWFQLACRAASGHGLDQGYGYMARAAFLEMGTNAVPFLLREVMRPRKDNWIRTNLHEFFGGMPEWAGRGAFLPYDTMGFEALRLLRAMRPPASVLLPRLEPYLANPDPHVRWKSLFVLGGLGDGCEAGLPYLLASAGKPTGAQESAIAWQSIRWMGARSAAALPLLLERTNDASAIATFGSVSAGWLAELGEQALPAVPLLEAVTRGTNALARVTAALALVRIRPDHGEAWRLVEEAADARGKSGSGIGGEVRPLPTAIQRLPAWENDRLGMLLEPLARAELDSYGPKGGMFEANHAFSKVAPARAKALYEARLTDPGHPGLMAAGQLVLLDRTHVGATRRLVETVIDRKVPFPIVWYLGNASPSNRLAVAALEDIVAGRGSVADPAIDPPWARVVQAQAREALARIRYRAAREARGLPELDW